MTSKHRALVTGASRGIGAAVVECLAESGIEVLEPSRIELDLLSAESVSQYIRAHQDSGIDILVNNAGINIINPIEKIRDQDWQDMLRINCTAPFELIRGFAPRMRGWGRIVNVSSIFGVISREDRGAYSLTKSGLNGFTRCAALEYGSKGILVNSVCPGYVDTELTQKNNSPELLAVLAKTIPLRRLARKEEIAKFIRFLCSDENTYITGQTLLIDGGFSCK